MVPFSEESLSRTYYYNKRKGRNLVANDRDVAHDIRQIKNTRRKYLREVKGKEGDELRRIDDEYQKTTETLKVSKENNTAEATKKSAKALQQSIKDSTFRWQLKRGGIVKGRQTYQIPGRPEIMLSAKYIEYVLRRGEVRQYQKDRDSIIRGLAQAMNRPYPHGIIRIDLKNFFDTLPHDGLKRKLTADRRIDAVTRSLINFLVCEYAELVSGKAGVPQGVGISSAIAEFYLCECDRKIRNDPRVGYFARFVDDIIIVVNDPDDTDAIYKKIREELDSLGLLVNEGKSSVTVLNDNDDISSQVIPYLGYKLHWTGQPSRPITIELSEARVNRIERKLNRAFENRRTLQVKGTLRAKETKKKLSYDGLLLQRLKFLTGNTRLHNAKSGVFVGIYHANRCINQLNQLEELDRRLKELTSENSHLINENHLKKIEQLSFVRGFQEKLYYNFNLSQMSRITSCWKEIA